MNLSHRGYLGWFAGAAWALAALSIGGDLDVFGRAHGPTGTLIVARPTLVWEIWSTGPDRIVGATATIDGRPVRAQYDAVQRRIVAEPAAPLAPGKHVAEVVARFSDDGTVKKDWEFEVGPQAVADLAPPTPEQLRAIEWVNTLRRRMGLPDVVADARLNLASTLHSKYLAQNNTTGHFQTEGKPGFFGVDPGDRAAAAGLVGNSWEVVEFGSDTPEEALRNLVDAPYHRLPFLQPEAVLFGSGGQTRRLTATFSMSSAVQTVAHPYEGQSDVPRSWDKNERPNPFRMHGAVKRPTGYPIMLVHFAKEPLKMTVRSAKLTDGRGLEVPCYLNTPENDNQLTNAMFLIPKAPLAANMTYVAQISATVAGGVDVSRTWSFSTRAK